jgi:predicted secreted protein
MRTLFLLLLLLTILACGTTKLSQPRVYEYDLNIAAQKRIATPIKFISYKDILIHLECKRYDTTVENRTTGKISYRFRLDTVGQGIINVSTSLYHKIDTFTTQFKIISKDSLKKKMLEGISNPYKYEKPLYDTLIDGVAYYVSDSLVHTATDSMDFRFYFIKNKHLHTIYSVLKKVYQDPEYIYAGFTMDDYKNNYFLASRIINYKEVINPVTLQKLEAIYQRFKRLQKSE